MGLMVQFGEPKRWAFNKIHEIAKLEGLVMDDDSNDFKSALLTDTPPETRNLQNTKNGMQVRLIYIS